MATTYSAAVDEVFGMVNGVLTGAAATLLGYTPDIRWPGVPKEAVPDKTKLWARVSLQIVTDTQTALANANGQRMFTANGLLFVQLFCPRNQPESIDNGRSIATDLQTVFRTNGISGEVWFTQAKFVELPETDESYPINFSTRLQYRTISAT